MRIYNLVGDVHAGRNKKQKQTNKQTNKQTA